MYIGGAYPNYEYLFSGSISFMHSDPICRISILQISSVSLLAPLLGFPSEPLCRISILQKSSVSLLALLLGFPSDPLDIFYISSSFPARVSLSLL